jgi:uncharacterized protein
MDMQGSRQLAATQQQAWDALNDPEVLKRCIPGCDSIERTGDDQYAITMSIKIGPVSAKFNGKIALQDVNAPQGYTLQFEGQGGAAGFGKGSSQVRLEPQPAGCELHYTASAQVGGKIAQVGQRLIDGVAKSMAEDFFKRFEGVLQEQYSGVGYAINSVAPSAEDMPGSGPKRFKIPVWAWIVGVALLAAVLWKIL